MDWVDELAASSYTPLPDEPPVYWRHGLVKYLELPDEWPVDWSVASIQDRVFVWFLELFDPPANLEGLMHQLIALEYIIEKTAENKSIERKQVSLFIEQFVDRVNDYEKTCSKEERVILSANQLSDITNLGSWRFHYHCSQVLRNRIDQAIDMKVNARDKDYKSKIIRVSKLEYLRDGTLDHFYKTLAFEIHRDLKRRQMLKTKYAQETKKTNGLNAEKSNEATKKRKRHIIYEESLACEHCVHLAHILLNNQSYDDQKKQARKLKLCMGNISRKSDMKITLSKYQSNNADVIKKVISSIKIVHNLISTFGGYRKRSKGKQRVYKPGIKNRHGRLLPLGRYEDVKEEVESSESVQIDDPFNLLCGITDDGYSEGLLRRKYGDRPKILKYLGESDEDYKEKNRVDVAASWLINPYRNAIKQQVQHESLIINQEPPVWSSQCLMVSTIIHYIKNSSRGESDLALLSLTALHTGLSELSIQSIRIGKPPIFELLDNPCELSPVEFKDLIKEAESQWTDIFVNPDRGTYSYLLLKGMSAYYDEQNPEFIQGCESASRIIRIPFPPVVQQLLQTWLEILRNKHGGLCPSDPSQPAEYPKLFRNWKKLSDRWATLMADTGRMSSENVTPARIQSTFRALYVGQMKLSPMYANLIMKETPINFRAQHFYANLSYKSLRKQYHNASHSIVHELDKAEQESPLSEPNQIYSTESLDIYRFGSRLVPTVEKLSTYFSELHESFRANEENRMLSATTWNQMALFVFRLLQLATGIRPAKDFLPDWGSICFRLKWIRLSDKDNLHFYESRIIPMATKFSQWLEYFALAQRRYFIGMNYHPKDLPKVFRDQPTSSIFVSMDEIHREIRSFSLNIIEDIEAEAGLSFPYKANALRHHLETRLVAAETDQHLIDFIMGHKHFGSEPFGRFSPISSSQYATLAIQQLDEYVIQPLLIPGPPAYG